MIYMNALMKSVKNEKMEYIVIVLMILFIMFDVRIPRIVANFVDNLVGRIVVIGLALSLLFVHKVLGVVAVVFAYELIKRSEQSTGTYQMRHFLPSESKKNKQFSDMNQFPVTLEEEMIQKMVPLVDKSKPILTEFKPVMHKLYNAAKL